MWQAKTCILEMFLDFYGVYSENKSNYRDFLKDILTFYEQNAVGRKSTTMYSRYSSVNETNRSTTGLHRIHNNIFDIASRQSLTFDVDNCGGSSAPLPRISGLCTTRAGPDVDIDYSRADEIENTATVEEVEEVPDHPESVIEVLPPYRHVKSEPDIWEPQVTVVDPPHPVISQVQHRGPPSPAASTAFRQPLVPASFASRSPSARHASGDSARFTPSKGSRMKTGGRGGGAAGAAAGGGGTPTTKPASVVCNICHRQMTSYRALIRHRSTVHSHRPVSCPRCKKHFVSRTTLARHQRTSCYAALDANDEVWHEQLEQLDPDFDPLSRSKPKSKPRKTKPKASHTTEAGAFLPALDAALRQQRTNKVKGKTRRGKGRNTKIKKKKQPKSPDGGLRCTVSNCRQNFPGRTEYLEHLQLKHSDRKALLCEGCEKVFLSARHWRVHMATHRDLFLEHQDEPPELEPELDLDIECPPLPEEGL